MRQCQKASDARQHPSEHVPTMSKVSHERNRGAASQTAAMPQAKRLGGPLGGSGLPFVRRRMPTLKIR